METFIKGSLLLVVILAAAAAHESHACEYRYVTDDNGNTEYKCYEEKAYDPAPETPGCRTVYTTDENGNVTTATVCK